VNQGLPKRKTQPLTAGGCQTQQLNYFYDLRLLKKAPGSSKSSLTQCHGYQPGMWTVDTNRILHLL